MSSHVVRKDESNTSNIEVQGYNRVSKMHDPAFQAIHIELKRVQTMTANYAKRKTLSCDSSARIKELIYAEYIACK